MPALTLQSWFVLKYLPVVVEGENLLLFSLFDKTPPPFYWIVRQQNVRDLDELF